MYGQTCSGLLRSSSKGTFTVFPLRKGGEVYTNVAERRIKINFEYFIMLDVYVCHMHLIWYYTYICVCVYSYAYLNRYIFILYVLNTHDMPDMEIVAMCIKLTLKFLKSKLTSLQQKSLKNSKFPVLHFFQTPMLPWVILMEQELKPLPLHF